MSVHSRVPKETKEGFRFSELSSDGCEPSYMGAGELNSGPLKEPQVLLTAKSSL